MIPELEGILMINYTYIYIFTEYDQSYACAHINRLLLTRECIILFVYSELYILLLNMAMIVLFMISLFLPSFLAQTWKMVLSTSIYIPYIKRWQS